MWKWEMLAHTSSLFELQTDISSTAIDDDSLLIL